MQKANFLSGSYRKQRLKEEGSLEKQGGGKNEQSMGMGLKENIAQTPDVGTPCARTPTCIQRHADETGW